MQVCQLYSTFVIQSIPMKPFLPILFLIPLFCFAQSYPIVKKTPKTYTSFGITYTDEYSAMEKMRTKGVKKWVDEQNDYTDQKIRDIGTQYDIENTIQEYRKSRIHSMPRKKGDYFYTLMKPRGLAASLYYFKSLNSRAELLVDMSRGISETAIIADYEPSEASRYLAYTISGDGSDRRTIRFKDMLRGLPLDDVIKNVKFADLSWNGKKGIFYTRNSNVNMFAQDSTYQIYYHTLGNKQEDDALVFDTTKNKGFLSYYVEQDKLFIFERNAAERTRNIYYSDLASEPFTVKRLFEGEDDDFRLIKYRNGKLYYSSSKFEWGDVRSCPLDNRADEKIIVPQFYGQLLDGTYFYDDYLICKYKTLGKYHFMVYDANATFLKKIDIAPGVDAQPMFYDKQTQKLYLKLQSYTASPQNFSLSLKTGEFEPFYNDYIKPKPTLFPSDHFETKTITYKSRDGKDVPITIIHKKKLRLDGTNPTLLEAYGGFGMVSEPNYSDALVYFLEQGGVYAYAEIRGGGEKGSKWASAGKGINKLNCLNDFIDAAEFLIAQKYTAPQHLGITGASHGGLVVGHAMIFRPDLFKAVVCKMGVLDMCRRVDFGTGARNMAEYDNPATEAGFKNVYGYSPYQHIKEDVNYPAALIVTSEFDDRVPPMHSYKFAARLQNRKAQTNPVYLRTIHNAGHNGSNTTEERIALDAEMYSFLLEQLAKK